MSSSTIIAPSLPSSFSRADLAAAGFEGWLTWPALRADEFAVAPCIPGCYVVLRPSTDPPVFVERSPAGWFKGKDPSVSLDRLQAEWVAGAGAVYIGEADFRKRRREVEALRDRLGEFGRFGAGEAIAHWGGRLIWQLGDVDEFLVAWHPITWEEKARDYEKRLLARFAELHDGRRPFANLTG